MSLKKMAAYKTVAAPGGNRYCFQCGITGAQFQTDGIYHADDPEHEALLAWEAEGRKHFNQCRRCGGWVVDVAYNPVVLECIECAPFEDEARYCKSCGVRVPTGVRICPSCGKRLYYEGVNAYDAKAKA